MRRSVVWIVASAMIALLTLGGLYALGPLNSEIPTSRFFLGIILATLFWISFVTLLVSLLCWIASKVFR